MWIRCQTQADLKFKLDIVWPYPSRTRNLSDLSSPRKRPTTIFKDFLWIYLANVETITFENSFSRPIQHTILCKSGIQFWHIMRKSSNKICISTLFDRLWLSFRNVPLLPVVNQRTYEYDDGEYAFYIIKIIIKHGKSILIRNWRTHECFHRMPIFILWFNAQ